jgi:hypothetical protein
MKPGRTLLDLGGSHRRVPNASTLRKQTTEHSMKIEFVEDIDLALRKRLGGRVTKRRRFKPGEVQDVEFLGEDSDLETIDFQFENGLFAIKVPRLAVRVTN